MIISIIHNVIMVIPIKDLLLRAFTGEPNKIDELKPERKFLRQKVALIMKNLEQNNAMFLKYQLCQWMAFSMFNKSIWKKSKKMRHVEKPLCLLINGYFILTITTSMPRNTISYKLLRFNNLYQFMCSWIELIGYCTCEMKTIIKWNTST